MPENVIVLTGCTRGLGLAMTEEFISRGHTVCGCGTKADGVRKMTERFGDSHDFQTVNVVSNDEVRKWAADITSRFGAPDYLINNAGVINRNAPLWKVPVEEFDRVIDVNIKGVANVIRNFLPSMMERGKGVIVNFSSGWGRSTSPEVAPYCATKWAIEGLSQALAEELPEGLAAVPLNPGVINTEMLQSCFGPGASSCPSPEEWAKRAVPYILKISPKNNGRPLSVGG